MSIATGILYKLTSAVAKIINRPKPPPPPPPPPPPKPKEVA
jgi:hypothetical protein